MLKEKFMFLCNWFEVASKIEHAVTCMSNTLDSTIFCVLYVRMNHCEANLMVWSRVNDFKGLRMEIKLSIGFWLRGKMENVMFDGFSLV